MPARHRWIHSLAAATGVIVLLLATSASAGADALEEAEAAADRGDKAAARAALTTWFKATSEDPDAVLRAAQLARSLPDIELLRSARAVAEALEGSIAEAGAEPTPPALHLALGFAYLGLAEENLRLRTTSRSISLYFADALTRAGKVPATSEHGETAARLAAGVRFAQGDLPGALEGLAAHRAAVEQVSPRFEALAGRLIYEQAAAMPVTSSGHATPEAQALLRKAAASLELASKDEQLPTRIRNAAALREGYAHHRLGEIPEAEAAYDRAFAPDLRQATLVVRAMLSLHARVRELQLGSLRGLADLHGDHVVILDAWRQVLADGGDLDAAYTIAQRRIAVAPQDPASWVAAGQVLAALAEADQHQPGGRVGLESRAVDHFARALALDANDLQASFGMEQIARRWLPRVPQAAVDVYERLITLRPGDPYTRNNYGFILRDLVSAHTDKLAGGLERIPRDAPASTLARLQRCVEVYAEAAAAIDPAKDADLDAGTAWNLAGIINDYGLIVHYFLDVQDAALAERLYLRALEMTDYGFKDTYVPNMRRLYGHVLTGPEHVWRWYRIAREARYAILVEEAADGQGVALVPDEAKRAVAEKDVAALRARILQVLEDDAREDGLPWPPTEENGNDR